MKKLIGLIFIFNCAFIASAQNWDKIIKRVAADRSELDYFGNSVAISGDYAIVGVFYDDHNLVGADSLNNAGSVYFFKKDMNGNWHQHQKMLASDRGGAHSDWFGFSVDIDGDYAVIGAYGDDDDSSGNNPLDNAGSAYIVKRNSQGIWEHVQKVSASERRIRDLFGFDVAISGDYVLVGAHAEEPNDSILGADFGAVFIFEKSSNGVWTEVTKLVPPHPDYGDVFGYALDISGTTAIISAYGEDKDVNEANPLTNSGAVYFYERNTNGNWLLKQKMVASDRDSWDQYGTKVSVDSNIAIVNAPREDDDELGQNKLFESGSVYVYENVNGLWTETQKIVAPIRTTNDEFGYCISLSNNTIAIGARWEDEDTSNSNYVKNAGAAFIYERDNSGKFQFTKKIVPPIRAFEDNFGDAIALDGNSLIIAASAEDEDTLNANYLYNAGAVYFVDRNTKVSVEDLILDNISFYPNPIYNTLNLKIPTEISQIQIIIYNSQGVIVYENSFENRYFNKIELDLSAALYVVDLKLDNKYFKSFKLVKF